MNTVVECEHTLLVQADFDGELDAGQAAALVRHVEACAECRAVQEKLVRSRALMRAVPRYGSSVELRERLGRAIRDDEQRLGGGEAPRAGRASSADEDRSVQWQSPPRARRWSWQTSAGWAAAAAMAVVAVILSVAPLRTSDLSAQLVNNHLRAMQLDSHLIDVVSTDHHTVKPWFAGKVDFAPPVKQLDAEGYVLKGGRIDVVEARTAAVLVYQAGKHTVEVFIWPAHPENTPTSSTQQLNGFNLRRWEENGFEVWCVSDMAGAELDTFASRWREAS